MHRPKSTQVFNYQALLNSNRLYFKPRQFGGENFSALTNQRHNQKKVPSAMFDFGIVPFSLAKDWLSRLYSELSRVNAIRKDEIDEIANLFGDPLELARNYVEPDCQQFNPADSDDEEAYHLVREPIFERIETFLSGEGARQGRQLFVLSDAGMGKTSLLVMLKLGHLLSFWPKGQSCILLKLGKDTAAAIHAIKSQRDTVLLLDALDEDPLAWTDREKRTSEILEITKNFRRTLITCRTQFLAGAKDPFEFRGRISVEGHLCPVIYNALFTDKQVVRYLNKRYPLNVQSIEWQQRVSSIIGSMGVLRMRPMLLAYIEDLVSSPEKKWNEYTIYRALVNAWLHRERRKLMALNGSAPSLEHLLDASRYMAVLIFNTERKLLTAEAMSLRSEIFSKNISTMQLGVRSLLTKDTVGNYRFSHFSILEYLIVDCIISEKHLDALAWFKPTNLMPIFAAAWIKLGNKFHRSLPLLKRIGLVGADFSDQDLTEIDLSGFDCQGANFASANLASANFLSANLKGCSFYNGTLRFTNFTRADMSSTSFNFANLESVKLAGAKLVMANFESAELIECNFDEANLMKSKFDSARLAKCTFNNSDLSGSSFESTQISNCEFKKAIVTDLKPDFVKTNLSLMLN